MNCRNFRDMIPAFEADELNDEQLSAFLSHYKECATCREDLSIQLLVDRGLDHLATGQSFNLKKEVEQTVTESTKRLKSRRKLERTAYTLEMITVGIALVAGAALLILWGRM
ncbi:MAG: zf-HC2 domain-containing protein [Lachnospiraceae bacterium]|nr:zf-HC2 domain-containing protein [Lachnospiraceae bacterium]MBQ9643355.1 zf-HC2 domain-containing protein [Lachnospiraceae bacterium]